MAEDGLTITLYAGLNEPRGVAAAGGGRTKFYVADSGHNEVKVVDVSSFGSLDVLNSAAPAASSQANGHRAVTIALLTTAAILLAKIKQHPPHPP